MGKKTYFDVDEGQAESDLIKRKKKKKRSAPCEQESTAISSAKLGSNISETPKGKKTYFDVDEGQAETDLIKRKKKKKRSAPCEEESTVISGTELDNDTVKSKKRKKQSATNDDSPVVETTEMDENSTMQTKKWRRSRRSRQRMYLRKAAESGINSPADDNTADDNDSKGTTVVRKKKRQMTLQEKMIDKLKSSQFRFLNERLYTSSSSEAQTMFTTDPSLFQAYHTGYEQQVHQWPSNPLDVIVAHLNTLPSTFVVADVGCGTGSLAKRVHQKRVHSFDLVSTASHVKASNMSKLALPSSCVDVAVYCLSLMGTDLNAYLLEANRILKIKGQLNIAEVRSRHDNWASFVSSLSKFGFDCDREQSQFGERDEDDKFFVFLDCTKTKNVHDRSGSLPKITLNPCLYKKR